MKRKLDKSLASLSLHSNIIPFAPCGSGSEDTCSPLLTLIIINGLNLSRPSSHAILRCAPDTTMLSWFTKGRRTRRYQTEERNQKFEELLTEFIPPAARITWLLTTCVVGPEIWNEEEESHQGTCTRMIRTSLLLLLCGRRKPLTIKVHHVRPTTITLFFPICRLVRRTGVIYADIKRKQSRYHSLPKFVLHDVITTTASQHVRTISNSVRKLVQNQEGVVTVVWNLEARTVGAYGIYLRWRSDTSKLIRPISNTTSVHSTLRGHRSSIIPWAPWTE